MKNLLPPRNEQGFTTVETFTALAILFGITTIALLNFLPACQAADDTAAVATNYQTRELAAEAAVIAASGGTQTSIDPAAIPTSSDAATFQADDAAIQAAANN